MNISRILQEEMYRIEGKSCKEIIGKERDGISNLDPSNPIFFHEYDTRLTRLSSVTLDFIAY